MSRPPEQSNLVDPLQGPEEAKHRLRVLLETITGETSVAGACAELGIGRSALFELRTKALMAALTGLTPGTPGRPPAPKEDPELVLLRSQLRQRELELDIERLRTAVALAERTAGQAPPVESKKNAAH